MSGKLLLLYHMPGPRRDRASRILERRGYELEWRGPVDGHDLPDPDREEFAAVLVYGGVQSANDGAERAYIQEEIDWIRRWLLAGRPYLGFCLGAQLMARALGARVAMHPAGFHEIGYVPVTPVNGSKGFLPQTMHVYHWHKEGFEQPEQSELLAAGPTFPNQAIRFAAHAYGLQFHPEVTPEQMTVWLDEASHMLSQPGAHDRERQLADAQRFDEPMARWFESFLERWLAEAGVEPRSPQNPDPTPET